MGRGSESGSPLPQRGSERGRHVSAGGEAIFYRRAHLSLPTPSLSPLRCGEGGEYLLPMTLLDQLTSDLITAMKAKDAATMSALRMLKSAIANAEIDARGSGKTIDEAAVLAVIKSHAKKLVEAIEEYRKGNRPDLVAASEAELKIISAYLPAMMPEDEVRKVVVAVRAKMGAAAMGPLMGAVMKELQGKADGAVVRKLVEEALKA